MITDEDITKVLKTVNENLPIYPHNNRSYDGRIARFPGFDGTKLPQFWSLDTSIELKGRDLLMYGLLLIAQSQDRNRALRGYPRTFILGKLPEESEKKTTPTAFSIHVRDIERLLWMDKDDVVYYAILHTNFREEGKPILYQMGVVYSEQLKQSPDLPSQKAKFNGWMKNVIDEEVTFENIPTTAVRTLIKVAKETGEKFSHTGLFLACGIIARDRGEIDPKRIGGQDPVSGRRFLILNSPGIENPADPKQGPNHVPAGEITALRLLHARKFLVSEPSQKISTSETKGEKEMQELLAAIDNLDL